MKVAIVGAGPAGSYLASKLAAANFNVRLYDLRKGAWEKPCGGGVTAKALRQYDFLLQDQTEYVRQVIEEIEIISPANKRLVFKLNSEFLIFSRYVLNKMLLDRACNAGAEFIPERVVDIIRCQTGWRIISSYTKWEADFVVGADGCTSLVRRQVLSKLPDTDQAICCGYYVSLPGTSRAVILFPKDFIGYLWAFPRTDHVSYGIINACGDKPLSDLWERLDVFVEQYSGIRSSSQRTKYAARVPMLRAESWSNNTVVGENWALVGDAAGFVDPITGEGIYYALRSAELLGDCLIQKNPLKYEELWRQDFEADLLEASNRLEQFYRDSMFGMSIIDCALLLSKFNKKVATTLSKAFTGDIDYTKLKKEMISNLLNPSAWF